MTAAVRTDRHGPVLVVTLNRPHVRNAVDGAVAAGVAAALDELDADDELAVGVLCGAGPGFCAGMDLRAFAAGERPWIAGRGFAGITEHGADKPLIAAVEGFALAGGLEIALACDLVVAGRGSRLGIPETRRGLVAAGGGLLRLPQRLGPGRALLLALTGEPVSAERGAELGLVDVLADAGEALACALDLAGRIAQNAPLALRATKAIVRDASTHPGEFWARQAPHADAVLASRDAREGARAFVERRRPRWEAR